MPYRSRRRRETRPRGGSPPVPFVTKYPVRCNCSPLDAAGTVHPSRGPVGNPDTDHQRRETSRGGGATDGGGRSHGPRRHHPRPSCRADATKTPGAEPGPVSMLLDGRAPRRSGRSAQPQCSASPSPGGRCGDRAFGVSLAGFGAPAIRRRRWTASPGSGLQAAHPRQSPRRQYLQGQHLRCRRRLPLADHRRSRLSIHPRRRPQWRHQTQLRGEAAEYPISRALGASLPPLGVPAPGCARQCP